jgi:hypothetical protein
MNVGIGKEPRSFISGINRIYATVWNLRVADETVLNKEYGKIQAKNSC